MYLFFDTETSGLPRNYNAPITDFNNWPRLVQLAFIIHDENANVIKTGDCIIYPEGFKIPLSTSRIHHITTEVAIEKGFDLKKVLNRFSQLITENCQYLVAHNMAFDDKIIGAEFLRCQLPNPTVTKKKLCTMEASKQFVGIKRFDGTYKWPTLQELYYKLFGESFKDAHDAMVDITATSKCFFELKKRGIIKI